jgi:uncharacterized protein (TIGR03435 family)
MARGLRINPQMLSGQGSVTRLLSEAYLIPEVLITGGPAWLKSDVYTISARTDRPAPPDQVRLMLRVLLAERFNLKVHREARKTSFYALVPAERGSSGPKPGSASRDGGSVSNRSVVVHLPNVAALASRMSMVSGRLVIDDTGEEGVNLTMTLEAPFSAQELTGDRRIDAAALKDAYFASLVRAAQQSGLRLESRHGPLDVLIVDSATRPTEN